MASSLKKLISSFLLIFSSTITVDSSEPSCRSYKSIISFGDSGADTGNYLHLSDVNHPPQAAFLPYGETFFHAPTGRNSDGRLIIDFIAEFLRLPYVPPYFGSQNVSFKQGINFAVFGATALDHCKEMLGDSLILMGDIGANDYVYMFFQGKSINEVEELVPLVIKAISSAIVTAKEEEYDPFTGCLSWLNAFGKNHDEQLKTELRRLWKLYPHVNIIYADYYNSMYRFFQEPAKYGTWDFRAPPMGILPIEGFKERPLGACCGVGGQYNFTIGEECGYQGVGYCKNPSEYVNWDGYHLTEATHQKMVHGLLKGPYATPAFD
ncbi:hypothetical protein DY000_02008871 [Brassica cretica]|uniref:Uncharacterized protein n=1 Tax=Brassica cretica TaxID=69181 RepID=A0ABQ7C425_BRACR|nr:hypothetical protein DY000_02008871 [Brassica cretica]